MKIAVITINTGQYIKLLPDFVFSVNQFLFPDDEKDIYVFTDSDDVKEDVIVKKIKHSPWPYPSLYRFRYILSIRDELKDYDLIYFFNANSLFISPTSDVLLPKENKPIILCPHIVNTIFPYTSLQYEQNPNSTAYHKPTQTDVYIMGGLFGGKSEDVLNLCKQLDINIQTDIAHGIQAIYHDESYLNKYAAENRDKIRLIPMTTMLPEDNNVHVMVTYLGGFKNIVLRDKNKYFDMNTVREPAKGNMCVVSGDEEHKHAVQRNMKLIQGE